MERSPGRLRNAGGLMTSDSSENFHGGRRSNPVARRSVTAADHSREQVQSALDTLLSDNDDVAGPNKAQISSSSYNGVPVESGARSPGPAGVRRRSRAGQDPAPLDASNTGHERSPSGLSPGNQLRIDNPDAFPGVSETKSPGGYTPSSAGGYTPSAAGGRRRRSSVRSPKAYNIGSSQGLEISTLEGLQVFLDGKQREVVNAHARRTNELDTILTKEENYFGALLDNELEKMGVKLKATSAMLKGQSSVANALFRRGSRRLSHEGVEDAMQSKHSEEVKKADYLRKKLKAHHEEARASLAKKLQVENTRMGRVIKTNLGKYANPKLAQGAKAAVLASITEYLNGEEFVRIVSAPLNYASPDFVVSTEQELESVGISYSPTNARHRSIPSSEPTDYDSKMAQLQEKKTRDQMQRAATDAQRRQEGEERERKVREEQAVEDLARAAEEAARRKEEMRRQQEEELEEQKRQLDEHQETLRKEAEAARARHTKDLERRRADMARDETDHLARQAEAKRLREEELARQREEMQRKHDEDMEKQKEEFRRHEEEVAKHKEELAKHNKDVLREQKMLQDMSRRVKEGDDDERRRLEEEVARHKDEMKRESERVKKELKHLRKERESIARKEEAKRAAADVARLQKEADALAEARKVEQAEQRRRTSQEELRAEIEAEVETKIATELHAERGRVAAKAAALEEKMRVFEEQQKAAAGQAAADREAILSAVAREKRAAGDSTKGADATGEGLGGGRGERGPTEYQSGDKVEVLCTPVGAAAGTKAYISGEVGHRNHDGSLDVFLSDGRIRQDVPLSEIRAPPGARPAGGEAETTRPGYGNGGVSDPRDRGETGGGAGSFDRGDAKSRMKVKKGSLDDILATKDGFVGDTAAAAAAVAASVNRDAASRAGPDQDALHTQGGGAGEKEKEKKRDSLDDILGSKLGTANKKSGAKVALRKGDAVEVFAAARDGEHTTPTPGTICRLHGDGFIDVELATGKKVLRLSPTEVRLVPKKGESSPSSPAAASSAVTSSDYVVGDRVEARYAGNPEFLPGLVTSTEDGVSVNFDVGWHGASIPLKDVRRVGRSPPLPTSGRGAKTGAPHLTPGAKLRSTGCILDLDVGSLGGDTSSVGDQVQFRANHVPGTGPPRTKNGVIRAARPNGTYLVGFEDGSTRDQVLAKSLTDFQWARDGSAAHRRAAGSDAPVKVADLNSNDSGQQLPLGVSQGDIEGAGQGNGRGPAGGLGGSGLSGSGLSGSGPRTTASAKVEPGGFFNKFGSGKILPVGGGGTGSGGGGAEGGDRSKKRRGTHDGVIGTSEREQAVDLMHFKPRATDSTDQGILTPNNAGMFRSGVGRRRQQQQQQQERRKQQPQLLSELSYNTTTDESEGDLDSGRKSGTGGGGGGGGSTYGKPSPLLPSHSVPPRRMTFSGYKAAERSQVYKPQRRPSFLEKAGKRAVKVAVAATKATRRLSFYGNNGEGAELVAIGDRKKSLNGKGRRGSSARVNADEQSDDEHSENETHFYNRRRKIYEPQHTEEAPSTWFIRVCGIINLICMAAYLWWRFKRSLINVDHIIWAYTFLGAECIMALGMIVGHSSRSFPVHREKVFMDDLTDIDDTIGQIKVAVLVPTCGEKISVMLKALFGNLQLRLWRSQNARRETLRIVVLDEKRREEVQKLVSLVYTLAEVVLDKTVREILMREGVVPVSAKGFYDHFANGEHSQRMYDDVNFIRGVEIVTEIDKLIEANDDSVNRFSPSVAISRIKERARRASCFERKEIQPGQKKIWNRNKYIPTILYYSRIDAGQPRISPKAGNMNRAIFSANPQEEPLIGPASIIVVNDVRHELYPEFLQRTVPYFFTFDKIRRCYKWADIAFVQTPQRFHDMPEWNDPDPLGNQAATQFDIVNSGRDGVGGALSCGQGSLWRVQVMREGIRPNGSKYTRKGPPADQIGKQGGLGFRSEVLIEDTHTSIDLFRHGWKSVYVNFPKEVLACCTWPPDTVKWRWKQVLRWHQGAVQLAMWKGWKFAVCGENWGAPFQKVFAFDALSYFLQAFAGEILLVFPVVYGFTNSAPFNTWNIEFALFFFPFIITGVLPTIGALGWQKTPSEKVMRDEQIWFATSFVQIYAVLHAVWGTITRKDPSNAWECKCPVWPLYAHFIAIIVASCYNTVGWVNRGFDEPWVWVSCIGSAMFALHSLWPVVSFGLGVTMPPAFYTRVFGMLVVMTLVSMWLLGESTGST